MKPEALVARLLSLRLGLSPESLGAGVVKRAVEAAIDTAGPSERAEKAARLLLGEGAEWDLLVDDIVVRETWFFRDREPFRLLASYVMEEWLPAHAIGPFRVLCIPCGTGEEPLSVAMTLLESGLHPDRIRIDAADVSEHALHLARRGVYRKNSFRERLLYPKERYFLPSQDGVCARDELAALVRFEKGNLLELSVYAQREPYNAVFCRNALIYFEESARRKVMTGLGDLLTNDALLFTGHTELSAFIVAGYLPAPHPQSFACRKGEPKRIIKHHKTNKSDSKIDRVERHWGNERAKKDIELSSQPSENACKIQQAGQLANRGELNAAADICRRMLAAGSRDSEIYFLMGVINESWGEMDEAEDLFNKALFLNPYHYESLVHMSLLCERRGDRDGLQLFLSRADRILSQQAER
jgi:chemotaxis protein methyltransferase WspC